MKPPPCHMLNAIWDRSEFAETSFHLRVVRSTKNCPRSGFTSRSPKFCVNLLLENLESCSTFIFPLPKPRTPLIGHPITSDVRATYPWIFRDQQWFVPHAKTACLKPQMHTEDKHFELVFVALFLNTTLSSSTCLKQSALSLLCLSSCHSIETLSSVQLTP